MSGKKGEHEPEKEGILATIWDYAKTFLIIFLVVFALNKLVYINAVIPSESMQTTIMKGDRIIGSRLAYKSKDPQRFDIVIFKYPDDPSKIFIKSHWSAWGDCGSERRKSIHRWSREAIG